MRDVPTLWLVVCIDIEEERSEHAIYSSYIYSQSQEVSSPTAFDQLSKVVVLDDFLISRFSWGDAIPVSPFLGTISDKLSEDEDLACGRQRLPMLANFQKNGEHVCYWYLFRRVTVVIHHRGQRYNSFPGNFTQKVDPKHFTVTSRLTTFQAHHSHCNVLSSTP